MRNDKRQLYLQARDISINFGPTQALCKMDFSLALGDIVGLIGANGAGKSTLMKIITGVYRQKSGEIIYEDKIIGAGDSYNPSDARSRGIYCAYQELPCCTNLKVYENFLLNYMTHTPFSKPGWRKRGAEETRRILDSVFPGNGISVNAVVETLPMVQRQMIEICKAIHHENLKVLVLDEPTSYLPTERISQLHAYLKILSQKGIAIIYISHKLDEIKSICSSVTIMRNGKKECDRLASDITKEEMISYLGGSGDKSNGSTKETQQRQNLNTLLEIKDLNAGLLHDVNMEIRQSEILGISGLDGGGQADLLRELYKRIKGNRLAGSKDISIAYVSGDRATEGAFPLWSIGDNISISSLSKCSSKLGCISPRATNKFAQIWFDKLNVKAQSVHDDLTSLSGGNQQKALIARGLATESDIILLNDPTCGVDIGTKQEIYRFMHEAKADGKTIILFSTEDYEMCECDRVYIMHEGTIVEEISGSELSEENIVKTAFKWKTEKELSKGTGEEQPKGKRSAFRKIADNRAMISIVTFLIMFAIIVYMKPIAVSYRGFNLLYAATIPLVLVGLSQMFVSIGGGIDMGNGMAIGMINVVLACIASESVGYGVLICLAMVIAYGLLGLFIFKTNVPAVIVTLGTSFIWKGVSLIVSPTPRGTCPEIISAIYRFKTPLVPICVIFSLVALLLSYWIVKRSKYGIVMNAVGNNPVVAERAGWSTALAVSMSYAIAGFFIVLAGCMLTAITGSGDYNCASTYPLMSIAIFILGGCEFIGAFSSPIGVVIAAFAMSSITTLLTFAKINSNYTMLFTGLVLILAMLVKYVINRRRRNV